MLRRKILSLFQQTIITPCAPVYNKMPKPCNGQCPACGTMNDPIPNYMIAGIDSKPNTLTSGDSIQLAVSTECIRCKHCSNAFYQDTVPKSEIHK